MYSPLKVHSLCFLSTVSRRLQTSVNSWNSLSHVKLLIRSRSTDWTILWNILWLNNHVVSLFLVYLCLYGVIFWKNTPHQQNLQITSHDVLQMFNAKFIAHPSPHHTRAVLCQLAVLFDLTKFGISRFSSIIPVQFYKLWLKLDNRWRHHTFFSIYW